MKKCAVLPKQLRRVSGAEEISLSEPVQTEQKQLRRVSGAEDLSRQPNHKRAEKQLRRVSGAEDDWMVDRDELLGNNSEE